jgi:Mce-associated membrane protein
MAAERSNKSRRTPRVAGRSTARVEISSDATARRDASVEPAAAVEATTAISGVERKRRRADEVRTASERAKAASDVEPGANDTAGTYRLAAIIAAVAVVIGVIATILAFHPGAELSDNRAFVAQGESDRVLAAARDGACAPFQFDYRKMDKWVSEAETQLTGAALDAFRQYLPTSKKLAAQTQASSDCRVDVMGLAELDNHNAVVVAKLIVSTTKGGAIDQSVMPHVRFALVRDPDHGHDDWQISEIQNY